MIISRRYRFIFFHNPKAGGTSVRSVLHKLAPDALTFRGDEFRQAGTRTGIKPVRTLPARTDSGHADIDEFSVLYPEFWQEISDYALWSTRRHPLQRFLSSVSEHSKIFSDEKIRFMETEKRRDFLFRLMERLMRQGRAEDLVGNDPAFVHFKPQWIYWHSIRHPVQPQSWPIENMGGFARRVEDVTGLRIMLEKKNAGSSLISLPSGLGRLRSYPAFNRLAVRVPGMKKLRERLYRRYTVAEDTRSFIRAFYARDLSLWPGGLPALD